MKRAELDLTPDKSIVMFHTVLVIGHDRNPSHVAITNNPLEHTAYAQIVMHKSRSVQCCKQVARYVRRTFEIEKPVIVHKSNRIMEAMIGYACANNMQYPPTESTPGWGVFQHIAATPISKLLEEVAGGHNCGHRRYHVYEVRSAGRATHRAITNKYHAIERRFRESPPDTIVSPDVVLVGHYPTQEQAQGALKDFPLAGDHLWTRQPSIEYLRKILKIDDNNEIVWTCDDTSAVRKYDFEAVVIGPHVYTEPQVRHALLHGVWIDRRTREGRKLG